MLKRFLFLLAAFFGISQMATAQDQVSANENTIQKAGYFNTTELSFSKGLPKENKILYGGLHTINGYRFNKHISAGLGVGFEQYFYKMPTGYTGGNAYLPVFSDVRIYFGQGKTRPFFSQAVGYAFCIRRPDFDKVSKIYRNIGGLMINPGFGFSTPLIDNTTLNFSVGYRFQETTVDRIPYYGDSIDPSLFRSATWRAHLLTFKAGVTF